MFTSMGTYTFPSTCRTEKEISIRMSEAKTTLKLKLNTYNKDHKKFGDMKFIIVSQVDSDVEEDKCMIIQV